jgi:hypothetical protein
LTASPDEIEHWVLNTLVSKHYRARLLALHGRSRFKFLNEMFVRQDVWRMELFERVPIALQRAGIVSALHRVQATPWYVIAQTDIDEHRVDLSQIIEFTHVAGVIAVTNDLKGAYLELEGKNASWVMGTAKRILGQAT